jgi:hypothetical protein
MISKTQMCKHKFGCYENVLRGWYRTFLIGFAIKSILLNLPKIMNPVKFLQNIFNIKKSLDSVRFALFLSCMNAVYKLVLCLMRRICKDDRKNSSVAGFLAGLTLIIDNKDRRKFIALILFARSLECLLNILDKRNIVKKFKYGELIPWVGSSTFTMYCMAWEQDCLEPSFKKFYLKASAMTPNDIILCDVWNKMLIDGKRV